MGQPCLRLAARLAPLHFAALLAALAPGLTHCARAQCQRNSDCPVRQHCSDFVCASECGADRDCPAGRPVCNDNGLCVALVPDAGVDTGPRADALAAPDAVSPADGPVSMDTPPPPPPDVTPPPPDAPPPPPDVTPPPPDVPASGTRAYLDACTRDDECVSGACAPGAPRFCTRTCATTNECAAGQICAAGRCRLDDTGTSGCDPATAAPCLQYCYGSGPATHCTHDCATAADCPSGFACSPVGARRVCVDIERPCTAATQCPSGLGFCGAGGVGCTADCTSASDCPLRLVGLPAYTCEDRGGRRVCVPPADVLGSDPLGAVCSAVGTIRCRSGACDDGVSPPMCNQRCSVRGGCPRGYGCSPLPEGGEVLLVCNRAGSGWVGDACGRGGECVTGLCQMPGYCSRLCSDDGLCPTGMFCRDTGLRATDGSSVRLCSR